MKILYGGNLLFMEAGDALDLHGGCTLDGLAVPCSQAMQRLNGGSAMYDPGVQWGRRRNSETGRPESFVRPLPPYFNPLSGSLSVGDAVFVPDYNDATQDYTDEETGAVVGVIAGRFVHTGARRFTITIAPQKTVVSPEELEAYRARIEGMLKSDKCSGFLSQLLDEAKSQTGKSYGAILATFDQIKFYWENTGAIYGGSAYFEHGSPAATVNNAVNTAKMGGSLANQRDYKAFLISQSTQDFLAETLHHVGKGMYLDGEMANVVNSILVRQGRDTPKVFSDKTMKDTDNASRYWHPKVWAACPAPRK